jgi:hypothetical protein
LTTRPSLLVRRGAQEAAVLRQDRLQHGRIGQGADVDHDVPGFQRLAVRAVREHQFHRHVFMLRLELRGQLGDVLVAEAQRRQDAQASDQLVLAVQKRLLQLVHFGQDQARALGQQLSLVRQRRHPALPVEQFQLQLVLDRLQPLGDRGWRHVEHPRGLGERGLAGQHAEKAQVFAIDH